MRDFNLGRRGALGQTSESCGEQVRDGNHLAAILPTSGCYRGMRAGLIGGLLSLVALGCNASLGQAPDQGTGTGGLESAGTGSTGNGTGSTGNGTGSTGNGTGSTGNGTGSTGNGDGDGDASACVEGDIYVGRAPIRRLTRFEYNRTIAAVLNDNSNPGNTLPPELLGNGFGNDADEQPVSSFLGEQYGIIAEAAAARAVANPAVMERFAPCFATVDTSSEATCARTFIENFGAEAYRRRLESFEVDDLLALQQEVQTYTDYGDSFAAVIEAVLQGPDFLYRVEFGDPTTAEGQRLRVTGHEMAIRLSYFFWGAPPDEELTAAAASGQLVTPEQVLSQAERLLTHENARPVIREFFAKLLPIEGLTDLARDETLFPTFSPQIGSLMRKEVETFLEHEIFEGAGDWASVLTSPHTFVNESLANYYGITEDINGQPIVGDEFVQANMNPAQRKGLLTYGGIMTGTSVSNFTNPVRRGVFLLHHIMCADLPDPPPGLNVTPPEPSSGLTGRERYSQHSSDDVCANCHQVMDPPGFALENFDAVGLWRDQENGVTIDASGELAMLPEPFNGPLDLVQLIAESEQTHACFAEQWFTYSAGRKLSREDACLLEKLEAQFVASGHSIKDLLLQLTQTDSFLYRPAQETL